MKIVEKFKVKSNDVWSNPPVTIAFLGDSVTQGCFELYLKSDGALATVFDKNSTYHGYISKILTVLYPSVPVNIINAGVSGNSAPDGFSRLQRDVLSHNPDLVVVCFGLNDCRRKEEGIKEYKEALENIFKTLIAEDKEVIFMTPNMLNTGISPHISLPAVTEIAKELMQLQNDGVMDKYIDSARELCQKYNIKVCDCYAKWKQLYNAGADVTELLSNKVNHPTREMNWLFAYMLVDTMMS